MHQRINAKHFQRTQIQFLNIQWRRFDDDLKLVIVLQAIGIFAVTPVCRAARGLHIGGTPRLRANRAQKGGGVKRARTDLHVIRLQQHATLGSPIILQRQNQPLKGGRVDGCVVSVVQDKPCVQAESMAASIPGKYTGWKGALELMDNFQVIRSRFPIDRIKVRIASRTVREVHPVTAGTGRPCLVF